MLPAGEMIFDVGFHFCAGRLRKGDVRRVAFVVYDEAKRELAGKTVSPSYTFIAVLLVELELGIVELSASRGHGYGGSVAREIHIVGLLA